MQTRRMHLDFVGKTYAVIINWLKILTVISLLFTLPFIEFIIRIQYSPCTFPFILHLMEFSLIFNLLQLLQSHSPFIDLIFTFGPFLQYFFPVILPSTEFRRFFSYFYLNIAPFLFLFLFFSFIFPLVFAFLPIFPASRVILRLFSHYTSLC